ncbi:hypothetical protein [Halorubrum halodurans]|uniref:hypothetical protein n=1 Tax=Halorubrum halodurans TaxID=1383851 RepID=UPI001FECFAFD|nr:hypothetical protein [Halorubrum halodurans]
MTCTATGPTGNPRVEQSRAVHTDADRESEHRYACSICGDSVTLTAPGNVTGRFDWFRHVDGTRDCSATDATGALHREAIELVMQRVSAIVGDPDLVEPETRVDGDDRFVTVDVHADSQHSPVAVEIFTAASHMHLRRRLSTLFDAGYSVFIVLAVNGRYRPRRVEQYLQRVSSVPVTVGRFTPHGTSTASSHESVDRGASAGSGAGGAGRVSLGTQLSRHVVDVDAITTPRLPAYMV